jgi:ribosomal protein L7/L12
MNWELADRLVLSLLLLAFILGLGAVNREVRRLRRRVAELEQQLAAANGSPTLTPPSPAVAELVAQRRKIAAIRLYRDETGAGLRDSKDAVEALEHGEAPADRR